MNHSLSIPRIPAPTAWVAAGALLMALAPIAGAAPPNDRGDADGDGLVNHFEYTLRTDPERPDTDGDNLRDGDEKFKYNTNPLTADTDGDSMGDWFELETGTDPLVNNNNAAAPPPLQSSNGPTATVTGCSTTTKPTSTEPIPTTRTPTATTSPTGKRSSTRPIHATLSRTDR